MQVRLLIVAVAAAAMLAGCHRVRAPEQAGVFEPEPRATVHERIFAAPEPSPGRVEPPSGFVITTPLPPSEPPPPPQLERVLLILRTLDQGKSPDDRLWITLRRGDEMIAERILGDGQPWAAGAEREVELWLKEPVALTSISEMKLEIGSLPAQGAAAMPWAFRAELLGRTLDGTVVTLLEPTGELRLGDTSNRVELPIPLRN